jgi:Yip1 domain
MDLIQRAKNICLTPATEWPVIAAEPATTGGLIMGYAAPLAAIGAVAGFIGRSLVGTTLPFVGTYRTPVVTGLTLSIFMFGMALVGVFLLSLIINALAPTFGGQKNGIQALKVAVYCYTPAWIAGVLQIVPVLALLGIFAALYGLYLLYLGLPRLMGSPEDKSIAYTAVVVICAIVLSVVISVIGAAVVGTGMVGAGMMGRGPLGGLVPGSTPASRSSEVQFDKNTPLGKLQDLGQKLEESNKKMEAAGKAGDSGAATAAALEGLGTLFGGGKHVDPINIDQLKPFVPDTFAGLPKVSSSAEKTGFAGLMVSKAEARYSDGAGKTLTLEISDTGGVSGITALAGWAGVQEERDDDNGSERTQKVNGRLMHEKISKKGGTNEFGVVLGDRFLVSASGQGVDIAALKQAVGSLDLAKLEGMKDVGVK